MNKTHYRLALKTIGKGLCVFFRSWGVTLNKLLFDTLRGIRHHWFFALMLVTVFGVMFVTMAQSRASYHHLNMVNYQLSQSVDSLTLMIKK